MRRIQNMDEGEQARVTPNIFHRVADLDTQDSSFSLYFSSEKNTAA